MASNRRLRRAAEHLVRYRHPAATDCPGSSVYRLLEEGAFAAQIRALLG
jgi:hypothetical protein